MRLHGSWVFSLRENLKKFIVGEEVESWKGHPLGLEVVAESLLYLVQQLIALPQVLKKTVVRTE